MSYNDSYLKFVTARCLTPPIVFLASDRLRRFFIYNVLVPLRIEIILNFLERPKSKINIFVDNIIRRSILRCFVEIYNRLSNSREKSKMEIKLRFLESKLLRNACIVETHVVSSVIR